MLITAQLYSDDDDALILCTCIESLFRLPRAAQGRQCRENDNICQGRIMRRA